MTARILQFSKSFLDSVDGIDARSATVFPPPRRREIYPGLFTKLSQWHDVKHMKPFHDGLIKKFPVVGVVKQWTDGLHLLSSLALTQYLVLTYPHGWFYNTCVNAISQQSTYGAAFMRYAKILEADTCSRDAALVDDLYEKFTDIPSLKNEKAFQAAQKWFGDKHKASWKDYLKTEEKQR